MRKLKPVFLALLVFVALPRVFADQPRILSQDFIMPGNAFPVLITGERLRELSVALVDSRQRTVSRSTPFPWRDDQGQSHFVVLLGVPPTASPGAYRLIASGREGRSDWTLEKRVMVEARRFTEATIPLGEELQNLFDDSSERRRQESRELWTVLSTVDARRLFHTGILTAPLAEEPIASYGEHRRFRFPDGLESNAINFGPEFSAEKGRSVIAAGKGRVVLAADYLITGNTVVLEHLPGVYSVYTHLDRLDVEAGIVVETGRPIGTVGETGLAADPLLHWELRVGAIPVDPMPYLERPLLDTNVLLSMISGTLREGR